MVLSLRAPSTPDPIQVAFEKFAEKFTASMKTWTDQFVEAMKQTRSKSEPVHDRRVLICGYTQGEDCICVSTETMESEYDDLNEAAVVLEEENGFQNQLQTQSDDDLVVHKVGDHEGLLATLEDPSPPIHLTCHQLIDDVCKVFDKSPERKLDTNKEFSGKELLRMVHPRESEYHYSPKSTLLTLEDSTTGNVKLINVSQASHIVKDANYQSIKECSHVLVNEFVNELSPEPPDKYVTKGDLSLTGSTITSDEVENLYNKDIEGATVSQVFDKIQTRNMDKNSPRFEENGNDVFLPLYILASVDSFEQICISQINHDMGIEGLNVENQLIDKYHGYITEPNIELLDDNGQIIHVGATKPKLSPKNVTHINIIGVYEERGMQQLSAFRFCKVLMDAALEVFEDMSQQDDLILSQSSKLFMAGPVENDKVTFLNTSIPASELPNLILKDNKQLEMLKAYNAVGIKRVDNVFDEWSVFIFCNKNETCLCVLLNNNSGGKIDGFYMHVEREQTIEGLECYEMESETGREEKNLLNKTLTKPKQNNKMEIDSKTVEAAGSSMQMDSEESLKDKAKVDIRESIEKLTMDKTTFKKKPIIIIMMGMAGSGKTTFLHRLVCHTQALNIWGYVLNLDPAVMTLLFGANIDIRDTVWYKEVMKQYNLGPSDGILTSHNLFATKFDEVILVIEKRADQLDYVLVDTLGQIEIFTWSVSGKIIIEAFASTFPTVVTYVVDTPRSANPNIFMSNMLYACSILYKTRLPLVLAFNKIDLAQHQFAFEWMEDFEVFHAALDSDHSYSSTLTRSLSLAFEEFYKNIQYVGVSAVKGDGMEAFFKAIKASAKEYMETYKADLDKRREEKQRLEEERIKESMDKLRKDMEKFMGETVVLSTALKDRKWSSSKMMDEEEKRTVGKVPLFMNVHDFVKMREKVCMEVKVKNGDSLKTILTAKKVRVYVCVIRIIFEHNVRRQAIRDVELLKSNGNAIVIFGAHFSYLWSEYGSTFAVARILANLASLKFLIESGGSLFLYSTTDDLTLPQDMYQKLTYAFNCILHLRTSTGFNSGHSYGHFFLDPHYENVQHIICCDSYVAYAYDFEFANDVGISKHNSELSMVILASLEQGVQESRGKIFNHMLLRGMEHQVCISCSWEEIQYNDNIISWHHTNTEPPLCFVGFEVAVIELIVSKYCFSNYIITEVEMNSFIHPP